MKNPHTHVLEILVIYKSDDYIERKLWNSNKNTHTYPILSSAS